MRIEGPDNSVSRIYLNKVNKAAPAEAVEAQNKVDTVNLSAKVDLIEAARAAIANTPDIREDKVESVRRELAQGTYQIDSEKIAEKMIAEARLAKQAE